MYICLSCGQENGEDSGGGTCIKCTGPLVPMRSGAGDNFTGRILGDKYVCLKTLGRGGMGSVYLAKHRTLGKQVAVKVMHMSFSNQDEALRRFYAEARNAASLQHPHNVKVFDFGHEDDGLAYIVMEVVEGKPLSALKMPLVTERALKIITQVCGALSEAHAVGLVHRDLKPDNIMIGQVDGSDYARVLDYGIAKSTNSNTGLTRTGMIVGTPEYLSPEQAQGDKDIDARSDIYSLGCVLFELLTGRPPFQASTVMGLAVAHVKKPPPRPSQLAPVSEPVEQLVLQCLEKMPARRPQSMRALQEAIAEILNNDSSYPSQRPLGLGTTAEEEGRAPRHLGMQDTLPSNPPAGLVRATPDSWLDLEIDDLDSQVDTTVPDPKRPDLASLERPIAVPKRRLAGVWMALSTTVLVAGVFVAMTMTGTPTIGLNFNQEGSGASTVEEVVDDEGALSALDVAEGSGSSEGSGLAEGTAGVPSPPVDDALVDREHFDGIVEGAMAACGPERGTRFACFDAWRQAREAFEQAVQDNTLEGVYTLAEFDKVRARLRLNFGLALLGVGECERGRTLIALARASALAPDDMLRLETAPRAQARCEAFIAPQVQIAEEDEEPVPELAIEPQESEPEGHDEVAVRDREERHSSRDNDDDDHRSSRDDRESRATRDEPEPEPEDDEPEPEDDDSSSREALLDRLNQYGGP